MLSNRHPVDIPELTASNDINISILARNRLRAISRPPSGQLQSGHLPRTLVWVHYAGCRRRIISTPPVSCEGVGRVVDRTVGKRLRNRMSFGLARSVSIPVISWFSVSLGLLSFVSSVPHPFFCLLFSFRSDFVVSCRSFCSADKRWPDDRQRYRSWSCHTSRHVVSKRRTRDLSSKAETKAERVPSLTQQSRSRPIER